MFETEAEEYRKDLKSKFFLSEPQLDLACQGFKDGYNKANEWHYVKDGLPDEGIYLVVWQNDKGYKEIFILKYEEDDEEELHWVDDDYEVQDEYVVAWKEIVLPELKESE